MVVELGHLNDQFAEIRSGIEAGDQVVISAQFLLDSESSKHSGLMQLSAPEAAEVIDHEAMVHKAMDHKAMDHKAIDHKAMDHSQMHHQE